MAEYRLEYCEINPDLTLFKNIDGAKFNQQIWVWWWMGEKIDSKAYFLKFIDPLFYFKSQYLNHIIQGTNATNVIFWDYHWALEAY